METDSCQEIGRNDDRSKAMCLGDPRRPDADLQADSPPYQNNSVARPPPLEDAVHQPNEKEGRASGIHDRSTRCNCQVTIVSVVIDAQDRLLQLHHNQSGNVRNTIALHLIGQIRFAQYELTSGWFLKQSAFTPKC